MQTRWLSFVGILGLVTNGWALVVTPSRTEVRLMSGASTQASLSVTNDDKVEVQVDVSKKDWFIPEVNKVWTVDRWLDIHGPSRFNLKPGESQKVDLTLHCPKDIVGEVVGMVSFLYQTEQKSMVTPMISVSMYVIAKGSEKMGGEIKKMIVRKWKGQLILSAVVKATGNVHLRPSGRLVVVDAKGTELASAAVSEGPPTYPGAENIYGGQISGDTKFPPGTYSVQADLAYQDLKLIKSQGFTVLSNGEIQMSPIK